jgi:hypothetical protein
MSSRISRHGAWLLLGLIAGLTSTIAGCAQSGAENSQATALSELADSSAGGADSATPVAGSPPLEGQIDRADSRVVVTSKLYDVDRIYKSMTGPWSKQEVQLGETAEPELVWITGAHVEMVDRDARKPMPELFMCHANLDLNVAKHQAVLGGREFPDGRMFTLSQGQLEVKFPAGFGIPVMSNETLDLTTQVLNLNYKDAKFQVRHHVTLDFIRDRDVQQPMKPLYQGGVFGLKALSEHEMAYDASESVMLGDEKCTSCCLPGKKAVDWAEGLDRFGRKFTGHWVVKPGREINHTLATTMFNLDQDTTIHYIAVHMHPFAESLELRDLTTGETLFKSLVRNYEDQIGLAHVDHLSSDEGVPVFADHEYEIVSTYNNTSGEDQDSMAVMYVYLLDPDFKRPDAHPVAQR